MTGRSDSPPTVRRRGWLEVRWRQVRHAPRPVVRAVIVPLAVAVVLGTVYLAYDLALSRGVGLPGGDLRPLAGVAYVLGVVTVGALVTWYVVPLPSGSETQPRRTAWSAALGFLAAVPISYLVLVALVEVVKPLIP